MPPASRRIESHETTVERHRTYIDAVDGDCVIDVLQGQLYWMCELAGCMSAEFVDKRHPPYTWTIRQVLSHCLDCERIFGDRMHRIAAGDKTDLPGFDENAYADARFGLGNIGHLVAEWGHVRQANLGLLDRIVPRAWDRRGCVDGHPITVRALAWLAAGHLQHHLDIVEMRCEIQVPRRPEAERG
ncbi:MAG: DinB family protein [Planctomycetota bacterium]